MPAIALGQRTEQASALLGFIHESFVILFYSYAILVFLLTLFPGVFFMSDLSLLFLLGLTAVITVMVSTVLTLAILIIRRQCGCFEEVVDEESFPIQVANDDKASVGKS